MSDDEALDSGVADNDWPTIQSIPMTAQSSRRKDGLKKPFRFLHLPLEIRYLIYEYILQPSYYEHVERELYHFTTLGECCDFGPYCLRKAIDSRFRGCTSITRTCKSVCLESTTVIQNVPRIVIMTKVEREYRFYWIPGCNYGYRVHRKQEDWTALSDEDVKRHHHLVAVLPGKSQSDEWPPYSSLHIPYRSLLNPETRAINKIHRLFDEPSGSERKSLKLIIYGYYDVHPTCQFDYTDNELLQPYQKFLTMGVGILKLSVELRVPFFSSMHVESMLLQRKSIIEKDRANRFIADARKIVEDEFEKSGAKARPTRVSNGPVVQSLSVGAQQNPQSIQGEAEAQSEPSRITLEGNLSSTEAGVAKQQTFKRTRRSIINVVLRSCHAAVSFSPFFNKRSLISEET